MNSVSDQSSETTKKPQGQFGYVWLVVPLALCLGLLLGHQWWPTPVQSSLQPQSSLNIGTGPAAIPSVKNATRTGEMLLGEHTIADIASNAAPTVVNINTKTSVSLRNSNFEFGLPGLEFFFGQGMGPSVPHKFESMGTGSGVIIRADGFILTNNHVVGKSSDIKVTLNDKRVFSGRVVGRDGFSDLALVKIDADNLPVAKFGSSKDIRPGDWAIAIGSPLGLDHTVTMGIVSALGRSLGELNNNVDLIQTDAAINPGNSGGPLLNIHGEVIGINTAMRSGAQNIGFAIPIDSAKDVVQGLLAGGHVSRPYVGIYMQELDAKLAKSLGLPENASGVVVANVGQGSPAEQAGIQQGDVIQRVDGKPVKIGKEVQSLIRQHKPGESVDLLIMRGRSLSAVSIKIGEYPSGDNSNSNEQAMPEEEP